MALTTTQLRQAIAARCVTAGLREAKGPLGAEMEPSTVIDRSFDVALGEDSDTGQRVQSGVTMRLLQAFEVRLTHTVRLGKAGDSRDAAATDRRAILRAMVNRAADSLAEVESTITYLGGTTEDRGGGAFLFTPMRFSLVYQISLAAP